MEEESMQFETNATPAMLAQGLLYVIRRALKDKELTDEEKQEIIRVLTACIGLIRAQEIEPLDYLPSFADESDGEGF